MFYTSNYNKQPYAMYYAFGILLPFSLRKVFIISTWSGIVIFLFRVIPSVLVLLHCNCPLTVKLMSYFAFLQKLPSEVFCKRGILWFFVCEFRERAPVLQSRFTKAADLKACDFIKRRLQGRCFYCVICKILETTCFEELLPTTASVSLNIDISLG